MKNEYSINMTISDLYNLGKYEEAINLCNQLITEGTNLSYAYSTKGLALMELNKLEEAKECFDKLIELDPTHDYSSYYYKAIVLDKLDKLEESLEFFNKAIEISGGCYANFYQDQGRVLMKLHRLEEAISYLDKAINLDQFCIEAYHNKGLALEFLNTHENAIECFNTVLTLDPGNVSALYNRAKAYHSLNQSNLASKDYNQAIFLIKQGYNTDHEYTLQDLTVQLENLHQINPEVQPIGASSDQAISTTVKIVIDNLEQ